MKRTYRKRSWRIAGRSPAGTSVKSHSLIRNDLEQTPATESLGVGLALDLQDVEGKKDNLSDTNQASLTC